jgi:hypothetical protein
LCPRVGWNSRKPRSHESLTRDSVVEVGGFEPPASSVRVGAGPVGALGVAGRTGSRKPIMSNTSAMVSDGLWRILLPDCFLIREAGVKLLRPRPTGVMGGRHGEARVRLRHKNTHGRGPACRGAMA